MSIEADEIRRRMPAIIAGEVAAINRTFQGRNLDAGTRAAWTVVAGRSYIAYGLRLGGAVLPQDIEKLLPKLSEAMSALRRRPTDVRLRRKPLALEVNHPFPAPLDWHKANTRIHTFTMLAGRNYSGGEPTDDVLRLTDLAHVLAVGMTGSGKSTLLRMMLASLALNTSPETLRLFIVDPKSEDFLPFKRLPHCEMFAGRQDITRAIAAVRAILAERQDIEGRFDGPRVVLFLDELSQVQDLAAIRQLNDLMAVGRSKRINVILATQYPTKDVIGKVDLSNVGVRFVGQVATNKEAYIAAGRGETGAHLLPGKGAFLRVEGADATRLQAYWLDDAGTEAMVDAAVQRWGKQARVPVYHQDAGAISAPYWPTPQREIVGGTSGTRAVQPVEVVRSVPVAAGVRFPIPDRPLTATEAAAVRRMYAGGLANGGRSKNSVITEVWGGLENKPKRLAWFDEAIEGGAA
jgi:hypothetical protein